MKKFLNMNKEEWNDGLTAAVLLMIICIGVSMPLTLAILLDILLEFIIGIAVFFTITYLFAIYLKRKSKVQNYDE